MKPDRLDWTYCEDEKITTLYKNMKLPFSLAINPQIPDSAGYTTTKYRIIDYKGNPFIAPWMNKWKVKNPYWGCVNNPQFYQLFVSKTLALSKLGPYAIFVDDGAFNSKLKDLNLVGCFCTYCLKEFKTYDSLSNNYLRVFNNGLGYNETFRLIIEKRKNKLKLTTSESDLIKSYSDFQEESVIRFLTKWKGAVKKNYPEMIFLTNNAQGVWNNIYTIFDGGIAEISSKFLNNQGLDKLYSIADANKKTQLLTLNTSTKLEDHLFLLRYNVNHNRDCLVPWDVYVHGLSNNERLYFDLNTLNTEIKQLRMLKKN